MMCGPRFIRGGGGVEKGLRAVLQCVALLLLFLCLERGQEGMKRAGGGGASGLKKSAVNLLLSFCLRKIKFRYLYFSFFFPIDIA